MNMKLSKQVLIVLLCCLPHWPGWLFLGEPLSLPSRTPLRWRNGQLRT
jgi:hypothetical protein